MASKDGSPKLNWEFRHALAKAIVEHRLTKVRDEYQRRSYAAAKAVYEEAFTPQERRKLNSLPDGWVPTLTRVYARFGSVELHIGLLERDAPKLRVPTSRYNTALLAAKEDHKLAAEVRDITKLGAALQHDAVEKLTKEVKGALGRFRTVNQFLEGWPEAAKAARPVIEKFCPLALIQPSLADLNKRLGLEK
jgi:hypothetical protein